MRVNVKDNNLNIALRKFKKKIEESGVLIEYVERQTYEKPTTRRRRKKGAARARWLKKVRDQNLPKKLY